MTTTSGNTPAARDPADVVLYLGAAVVVGVGLSWLMLAQPWRDSVDEAATAQPAATVPSPAPVSTSRISTREPTVEETLRRADVALSAGMLIEPERYSAWKLFSDALRADPNNVDAREGIRRVADLLLERGTTALEQGRTSDAREVVALVQRQFPDHVGATELEERITVAEEAERVRLAEELAPPVIETSPEPVAGAAPELTDPLEDMRADFDAAVAAGDLLQPDGSSARHFLNVMVERDADHALTVAARGLLVDTILTRAFEAIDVLDAAAARAWIGAARELGADAARADGAEAALTTALVTTESQRLRPANELTVVSVTPPRYPGMAQRRGTTGWVDVEFVVTTTGQTRDVIITDSSHETMFRDEAVEAVESWRFEPKIYLDRPIEQRVYMRISFALE